MKNNNKITLFIMSQKGFIVLQYITGRYKGMIQCVIASSDPNVKQDYYKEIKEYCKKNAIIFFDRKENPTVTTQYAFAISWRWLIPKTNFNLVVFHDSLLPKYRGFNPLVSMLINGESTIGVTALFASERYDEGDIIGQAYTKVDYPIKISTAIEKVSENYKELVGKVLEMVKNNNKIATKKQDNNNATYSLWKDEEDYLIEWSKDAKFIKRFIDAVGVPYKGASAMISNILVRIHDAEVIRDIIIENRTPGKVIFIDKDCPVVVCGTGLLKITNLTNNLNKSLLPFRKVRTRFH